MGDIDVIDKEDILKVILTAKGERKDPKRKKGTKDKMLIFSSHPFIMKTEQQRRLAAREKSSGGCMMSLKPRN